MENLSDMLLYPFMNPTSQNSKSMLHTLAFYGIKTLNIQQNLEESNDVDLVMDITISIPKSGIFPYKTQEEMVNLARETYETFATHYNRYADEKNKYQAIKLKHMKIQIHTSVRKRVYWRKEFAMATVLNDPTDRLHDTEGES